MTLDILPGAGGLRVVKVLSNGKRRFDPVEKDRLIDAALRPGVSVAHLALAHCVNANQLRNWMKFAEIGRPRGPRQLLQARKRQLLLRWPQRRRLRGSPPCRLGHHREYG